MSECNVCGRELIERDEQAIGMCAVCSNETRPKKQHRHVERMMTTGQRMLYRKHGTPAEFAKACYECVPCEISMDEARAAVEKYNQEWNNAKRTI